MSEIFKTEFRGYNKQDVADYIMTLNSQMEELKAQLDSKETELSRLRVRVSEAENANSADAENELRQKIYADAERELRVKLELELEKLQARNDTIHDRFFDESITKADYQRAKARCESEMNRVQEKIAAIKQRQTLNTDTQTLKPDIRAAITGIVSGRTADDDFYGHLLQQMTVYRDGRVEVALNLLPAKWVYVLDGLEKYRAKIGGHDASSVPMSVSRPLSSG